MLLSLTVSLISNWSSAGLLISAATALDAEEELRGRPDLFLHKGVSPHTAVPHFGGRS